MERFFNTAGPMIPEDHYCIDPLTRVDWDEIQSLVGNKRYFVLHAPRQTGFLDARGRACGARPARALHPHPPAPVRPCEVGAKLRCGKWMFSVSPPGRPL
jgi:hypothetical protein